MRGGVFGMRGQTGHTAVRVGGGGGIVSDWRDDRERDFSTKSIPKRVNVCPGKVFSYILYVFKIKKKPRGKMVERFSL